MIRGALIVAAILLSAASSAAASTRIRLDTSTVPSTLVYEESPGSSEASDLIVSGGPPVDITFQEASGVTIEPPSVVGCSTTAVPFGSAVTCSLNGRGVSIRLGALGDRFSAVVPVGSAVTCSLNGRGVSIRLGDLADRFTAVVPVPGPIDGGPGDDQITGSNGSDDIHGGDGNDVIDAMAGADTVDGGPGDDLIVGASNDTGDVVNGGSGTDTVDFSHPRSASDPGITAIMDGVLELGETNNIGADVENLIGTPYADEIVGNALDNVLDGGPGSCSDSIAGGDGQDTVSYATHTWGVNVSLDGVANDGGAGFTQYCGTVEADAVAADIESVRGSPFDDVLTGGPGPNTLDGGAGDDVLLADPGADTLIGGPGSDKASYATRTAAVSLTLDGVANDGNAEDGPPGARDMIAGDVEALTGGSGDDTLTGNAAANILDGGPGDDALSGGAGIDTVDYSTRTAPVFVDLGDPTPIAGEQGEFDSIAGDVENAIGGRGDDLLVGGPGPNVLDGGPGDDVLDGGLGADELHGGDGFDWVTYEGRTTGVVADLSGSAGDDGAPGEGDTIAADVEALAGGAGNDTLTGNAGDNELDGGLGADLLSGGPGEDTVTYENRTTGVVAYLGGAAGASGAPGEGDTIAADVEDLIGGSGDDTLVGDAGPNVLDGGPGNDHLDGRAGEDALFGGPGADDLTTRDGEGDLADCGEGIDLVHPDAFDELKDCENRDDTSVSPTPPPAPPAPPAPQPPAPATPLVRPDRVPPTVHLRLATQRLRSVRQAGLRTGISCSEPCTFHTRLVVSAATARGLHLAQRTLGQASGRAGTSSLTVVLHLSRAARRALLHRSSVRATLQITASDPSGNSATSATGLGLR